MEGQEYIISIDKVKKELFTYILFRNKDGYIESLLERSTSDEEEFNEEVENLAKYFNAVILGDHRVNHFSLLKNNQK